MNFNTKRTMFVVRNVLFMKSQNTILPTILDYAILGLLQSQNMSGYRIRKMFEETALGSYSSSPGTIYPALNRLQKMELVAKVKQDETGKFQFQLSSKGLDVLISWLKKPLEKANVEKNNNELFLRFAFMDNLVEKKDKMIFLESFRILQTDYVKTLKLYLKKNGNSMPLHGKLAFEHGLESNKTTLKWCKNTLIKIT